MRNLLPKMWRIKIFTTIFTVKKKINLLDSNARKFIEKYNKNKFKFTLSSRCGITLAL